MHTCSDPSSECTCLSCTVQDLLQLPGPVRAYSSCRAQMKPQHMSKETASLVPEVLKAGQRLPILVQHLPRLIQHICIETLAQDSHPCHGCLDLIIPHQGNGVIQMVEEKALCARLLHQLQRQARGGVTPCTAVTIHHMYCVSGWGAKPMTLGFEPAAGGQHLQPAIAHHRQLAPNAMQRQLGWGCPSCSRRHHPTARVPGVLITPMNARSAAAEANLHQGQARFRAASEGQAGAQGRQVLLQGLQAVVEPPARAAAGLELPLLLRGKHKDWDLQAGRTSIRGCWQAPSSRKGTPQASAASSGMLEWDAPWVTRGTCRLQHLVSACLRTALWRLNGKQPAAAEAPGKPGKPAVVVYFCTAEVCYLSRQHRHA